MIIKKRLAKQFPYDLVIVISPHPDDSCVAVGALLYRLATEKADCGVHVFIMTSGYRGVCDAYLKDFLKRPNREPLFSKKEIRKGRTILRKRHSEMTFAERFSLRKLKQRIREREVAEEAKILSFTPHYLDLDIYYDRAIVETDQRRLYSVFKGLHRQGKKRLVIYPGRNDAHQTHILCAQLTHEVLDAHFPKQYDQWTYDSPWARMQGPADMIIPLSEKALRRKVRATQSHRSQTSRTPYGNLVEGIAVRNAAVLSELLGSFNVTKEPRLGKYVEGLSRVGDHILYG